MEQLGEVTDALVSYRGVRREGLNSLLIVRVTISIATMAINESADPARNIDAFILLLKPEAARS